MAGGATDPEAERLKGQGNEKLKAGNAREALEIYEKALARLQVKASAGSALSTLSASLCLNAALACLQLETWEAAETFASRALRSQETSKGYFRRGLARAQMNGLEADAKRDFEFALKLEPKGSTAAVLVQAELAKLLSNSAASGYEAPPGTDPRRAKKFQIANASKQQQGLREVTFAEWEVQEDKVAAANAIASAWRKRLEEASTCPRPEQGAADAQGLSKLLEQLASKVSKPRATSTELVPDQLALSSEPASGIRGDLGALQLLVPGPFLFDGKSSVDVAFDPLANPTGSFSVECWAVCTAATGHQCLLSSRDQTSGKAGYMFYVEPDGLWSFWVGTGKSWAKLYGSTAVLGKWTHLRGTVDVQSKEARLYVDRQLVARGWASYVPNTRQALRLGAGKSEAEAKFFFTGDLRDVAVIGRLVSNEDLTDEMLKLAKISGPQAGPDLDQLPKLLRQEKGRGLQNASGALASALRWATGVLVPANAEDFRRSSLRLMECSPTSQGIRLLFLSFSIGAVLAAQGDELHMTFAGSGLRYWAVILQSGDCFKILFDVDGISSLQEALSRQHKLRADGWLTRKDLAMWLGALDTLAFGLSEDELEDALLTVFLFGFWASKMLTPQVRIKRFEGQSRSSQVQAALVEDVPCEALGKLLQTLTEEAQK